MSKSRIIVITGTSRGLGLAMARQFARLGHVVLGCGRSKMAINHLNAEFGESHQFKVVDVTSDRKVADWALECIDKHGPPDLLINNAA